MLDLNLVTQYQEMLLGERAGVTNDFKGYTPIKRELLKGLFRFIFEEILRWTPEETNQYISLDIIRQLKADKFLQYMDFPYILSPEKDLWYLPQILYPEKHFWTEVRATARVYIEVLNRTRPKYPKGFFDESGGKRNYSICFHVFMSLTADQRQKLGIPDIMVPNPGNAREIYEFFSTPRKYNPFLKAAKLSGACAALFPSTWEMLHEMLPPGQKDMHMYCMRYIPNRWHEFLDWIESQKTKEDEPTESQLEEMKQKAILEGIQKTDQFIQKQEEGE